MSDERPIREPSESEPKASKPKVVHVFGAGIAGMTAAHELALRGFKVFVYESVKALDARGYHSLAIGGLARTQYFHRPRKGTISFQTEQPETSESARPPIHHDGSTSVSLGLDQARPFPSLWLEFQDEASELGKPPLTQRSLHDLKAALKKLTKKSAAELGCFTVRIQPFYDQSLNELQEVPAAQMADGSGARPDWTRAWERAHVVEKKVKTHLKGLHLPDPEDARVEVQEPSPANTELGQPPTARNWVRVVLERAIFPGEHGYRYFPSYYRHVFDTMRRIPIYDNNALPTPRTTYDNLVALPTIGIASETHPPFVTNWGPYSFPNSVSRELLDMSNLSALGITPQDVSQFSLRVLRYMLTSPERRAKELEDLSWWDYIEGLDPKTDKRLYCYSEAFTHLVQSSGRVLVALDGRFADARTTGNTYVQLLTDVIVPTEETHATLNGPTSAAWFSHWHTHLRRLGVQFVQGELTGFRQVPTEPGTGPRFEPLVKLAPGSQAASVDRDAYYVVAVDVVAAEKVAQGLPTLGVPAKLRGYTTLAPAKEGEPGTLPRCPTKEPGLFPWDRLQTLSGIQYFFTTEFNIIDGYLYLLDAPWGISAICSPIAWQHRPLQEKSQYQSLLSVDIGDWKKGSPAVGWKSAWECTPEELGQEALRQIRVALQQKENGRPSLDFNPPEPAFVHIDQGLVFDGKDPGQARIRSNNTPFLLPTVGDWRHRPGLEPWDPTSGAQLPLRPSPIPEGVWQAAHGGYWVHWDQIVFAGTYNKTFTRLTTMESANESARHAVNAILDHYQVTQRKPQPLKPQVYEPLFPSTPQGDYCRIWNPEANELPDLMLLRQQDAENFKWELPHPWDLLGVEVLPSILSHLSALGAGAPPATATPADAFAQVESLLRQLGKQTGSGGGAEGLVGLLRRIHSQLEESLRRAAADSRPPTS